MALLLALRIEEFALVRSIELEFGPGLNVLTGETGAGKSIVIDAVAAVLGGRTSAEDVRAGSDQAVIEAAFDLSSRPWAAQILEQYGFDGADDTVVLTREIARMGRSRCRINGRLVNLSQLAEVGRALVDIHGQHDHQSLLAPARQLELLDEMGGSPLAALRADVERLAHEREELLAQRRRLESAERERAQREELLRYHVEEIDAAALAPQEEEELLAERQRLAHAERIARAVQEAYAALYGGDGVDQASANALLGLAHQRIQEAAELDGALLAAAEVLESALAATADAALDLRRYLERLEPDPERLAAVEERLALIARLKRKYGESVAAILAYRQRAAQELEELESAAERIAQLSQQLSRVEEQLAEAALRLSRARRETAGAIAGKVAQRLSRLQMPQARFEVAFSREPDPDGLMIDGERVRVGARGMDTVEFLFSANAGEAPRPLARIASGGEMSRVMLAIKGTLAEIDPVGTLIFDEVDAGLGGRAAESVGEALTELARSRQVLVVTHLPQIAALADRHFAVEKLEEGGRTTVSVRALAGEERVREIARMLDGKGTATGFEHARALLALAHKGKTAS